MPARRALKKSSLLLAAAGTLFMACCPSAIASQTAPVAGFARSFLLGMKLSNATITVLETGEKFHTDRTGYFGPFQYPVGKPITLQFEKWLSSF